MADANVSAVAAAPTATLDTPTVAGDATVVAVALVVTGVVRTPTTVGTGSLLLLGVG